MTSDLPVEEAWQTAYCTAGVNEVSVSTFQPRLVQYHITSDPVCRCDKPQKDLQLHNHRFVPVYKR